MSGRKYGYARVSTAKQNLDRQLIQLREAGVDERDIFCDKASGKNFDRENFSLLRNHILREGDELYVIALDRLGRNKRQTLEEIRHLQQIGVQLRVLNIPTTLFTCDPSQAWVMEMINNIIIEVYTSIAQNEREELLIRQAEGIAAAKAAGKHLGRKPVQFPENWDRIYPLWRAGNLTAVQAMEILGLKKSSFYKLAKAAAENENGG